MRCIYTGHELIDGDDRFRPSHEHIIPLALGGSNGFVTDEVCADANARAGNDIDDAVASLLPYLMLRHRYQLRGNRKVIPKVKLQGEFLDLKAPASVDIDDQGDMAFRFDDEQQISGNMFTLGTTEERARFLLNGRLKSAQKRKAHLLTPYGEIKDEEDIEIALLCAQRNEGRNFKGRITIDVKEYHAAIARLHVKIALGLANKVLGHAWTFSEGGDLFRSELFRSARDAVPYKIKGQIAEKVPGNVAAICQVKAGYHTLAVFPCGSQTLAIIALFGGECGICVMDLNHDWSTDVEDALSNNNEIPCLFEVPIHKDVSQRRLAAKSLQALAAEAALRNLI